MFCKIPRPGVIQTMRQVAAMMHHFFEGWYSYVQCNRRYMGIIRRVTVICRGYVGIMEKRMETTTGTAPLFTQHAWCHERRL